MILKTENTPFYSVALHLNVDYNKPCISLEVNTIYKKGNSIQSKRFAADRFGEALEFYDRQIRRMSGIDKAHKDKLNPLGAPPKRATKKK